MNRLLFTKEDFTFRKPKLKADVFVKAGFRDSQTRDETGKWSKKPGKLEDRPCFKEWFKDSKVVDGSGKPRKFYHGTTHDFNEFSKERGNIENDFGIGFYFSSDESDVVSNYDDLDGADLRMRIAQRMEEIMSGEDWTQEISNAARAQATSEMSGGESRVIPVYLSVKNPVVVGAPVFHAEEQETQFNYDYNYETGEESGNIIELADALRAVAYDYENVEIQTVINDAIQASEFNSGASAIIQAMRHSDGLVYSTDGNGHLAGHEVIRSAFEYMGFDGIIDNTVWNKFGIPGTNMKGMDEMTQHVIAFKSGDIKRTDAKSFCHETDIRKSGAILIDHKAGFKPSQQRDSSGKWSDRFSKEEIQKHEAWFLDPDRDGEGGLKQWEMAINHYVQNPWRLNAQLREDSEFISEKWLRDRLDYALTRLKKYKGDTWRGIRLSEQEWGELNKNLSSGNILFRAFTSSSKDHDFAAGFNDYGMGNERVLMRLIGKTGRDISSNKLSGKFAGQAEVLFPRNTSWEVLKNIELVNEDTGFLYHHLVLKETEKRSTKAGFRETQRRDRSGKWTKR